MGTDTKIQWCDHTFNPWEGCTKVSPGCAHCYAENRNARFGGGNAPNWGPGKPRRRTSPANWKKPHTWNAKWDHDKMLAYGMDMDLRRPRVFCASLADWLDDEVPIEWLQDFMLLTAVTPNLDWLLLTKRPENWQARMKAVDCGWADGKIPANIWVGTSVENQEWADKRTVDLLRIPARVHFLSVEPMLGPVDLTRIQFNANTRQTVLTHTYMGQPFSHSAKIRWVIVGGESGAGARPFNVEWARSLVAQCRAAGAAPFVKQLGSNPISSVGWTGPLAMIKDKKGGEMSEWPEDLRVREFPALLAHERRA